MIKLLQLECISYRTGFSLQAAAILLINEIHEITYSHSSWSMASPILCLWKVQQILFLWVVFI